MSAVLFMLRSMATFAVTMVHGPHWDRSRPIREQDGWDEHAAFMDGLVDDGLIILGGPWTIVTAKVTMRPSVRAATDIGSRVPR